MTCLLFHCAPLASVIALTRILYFSRAFLSTLKPCWWRLPCTAYWLATDGLRFISVAFEEMLKTFSLLCVNVSPGIGQYLNA